MTDDHRLEEEINRLYWGTDRSVADIAETVGASRRALYDAIQPRPAGATCPSCGSELTFRNRRGVQRREAECADCGREQRVAPAAADDADEGPATPSGSPTRHRTRDPLAEAAEGRSGTGDAGRSTLIGAAALIGLAMGAVTALLMRRR